MTEQFSGMRALFLLPIGLVALLAVSGCAAVLLAGGGYEAYQATEMEEVEDDYKAGRINKAEYEARKDQIDKSSIFQ